MTHSILPVCFSMHNSPRALWRTLAALSLLLLFPTLLFGWQQRVEYTMDIVLDTETHSYTGEQRLTYYNNSPDTLKEVYYHLFYEAFRPGSMMDARDAALPDGKGLGIQMLTPDEQGKVEIQTLQQGGKQTTWVIEETVLHVTLATPLPPGSSTVLTMGWRTQIPKLRRRGGWMSNEGVEYSMSQWYPKLAEYDANGWHNDEYIAREFYGVFGDYQVSITLPATYVVGGTGVITNPEEVGCGYQLGPRDTTILAPASGSGMKTWRFQADNVHDFAWVADKEYVHQITAWENITIHLLYKRNALALWNNAAWVTRATMEYFSQRFGRYAWPQFTVAMAGDGGMEYPQLIMITGYRGQVSLLEVIAHELGHQWFYGMMGNNETQEAWLDEGFTQYLTDEASRNLFKLGEESPYMGLNALIYPFSPASWQDIYSFYELGIEGYSEPLDTYHDHFREGASSGLVYYKGQAVLRMVQYMFGDSLFDVAMQRYYDMYKFRHPSARDFEHAMELASGMRMDLFINQWVNSNKTCDYALDAVTSEKSSDGYRTTLELSNRDDIIMPLDVTLTYEDGTTATAYIPMEPWKKPGMDFYLPRWRWVDPTYSTTFITPGRVVQAEIDTTMLLADFDRTNNVARTGILPGIFPPVKAAFYKRWDMQRPMDRYSMRLRPTLWYSRADGAQLGFVADGGYAFNRYEMKLGGYYNEKSQRVDYDIRYKTATDFLGTLTGVDLLATNADGVQRWRAGITKTFKEFYTFAEPGFTVGVHAEREVLVGPNYPNAAAPWTPGGFNTIGMTYETSGGFASSDGYRMLRFGFDASFASAQEFAQWELEATSQQNLLGLDVVGDFFAGTSAGLPPAQRLFNAAGATSRAMHMNEVARLGANIHPEFAARNHYILPGQGYLLSLTELGTAAPRGNHLLNIRIAAGNLNPFKKWLTLPLLDQMNISAYGAAGWLYQGHVSFDNLFTEQNSVIELGATASIDLLGALLPSVLVDAIDSPTPVRLSLWVPFFAQSPLLPDSGYRYRWAIGLSM